MKHILITGVSGYFGQKLVEYLSAKDEVERITGLDIKNPQRKNGKVEFIRGDVRDDLGDVFERGSIDCVIHTAYILPPIHNVGLMEDINVNGTKNVITTAVSHGVHHILDCSSTTVYGFHPDNPPLLTEESPLRGNGDITYAKNKCEIEHWLDGYQKDHEDVCFTVIRPCFVVGPGFDNPLARQLNKKVCVLPLKTVPIQYIHEEDLVEIMYLLMKGRKAGVFNLAADGTLGFDEMVSILGGVCLKLPMSLLRPMNTLMWKTRIKLMTEFPSPYLDLIRYPWVASNAKLKRELGYTFKYSTRTAFEDYAAFVKSSSKQA